jgi:hypothetical protein
VALGLAGCTPELNTPIVPTRGSPPRLIDRKPPHDCPITAMWLLSILPTSGEPARPFSAVAQSWKGSIDLVHRDARWLCGGNTTAKQQHQAETDNYFVTHDWTPSIYYGVADCYLTRAGEPPKSSLPLFVSIL